MAAFADYVVRKVQALSQQQNRHLILSLAVGAGSLEWGEGKYNFPIDQLKTAREVETAKAIIRRCEFAERGVWDPKSGWWGVGVLGGASTTSRSTSLRPPERWRPPRPLSEGANSRKRGLESHFFSGRGSPGG